MYSKKYFYLVLLFFTLNKNVAGQVGNIFFKETLKENRAKFYKTVHSSIVNGLKLPLTADRDENWINTFYNIPLIQYKSAGLQKRINVISKAVLKSTDDCKKAYINFVNSYYPTQYYKTVKTIANECNDVKLFAMAMHYLMNCTNKQVDVDWFTKKIDSAYHINNTNAILHELKNELYSNYNKIQKPPIDAFFDTTYLPNTTLVFSFQNKDRNYPGIVMIRKADGRFLKNDDGSFFYTGQLARSLSNMPGYITNGNTPQGIFKMNGFDTSENYFIGPTTNIQLSMPFEASRVNINNEEVDTTWTLEQYKNLLPQSFQNYHPIYGSYYAGKVGRTEIIAHGTTVNPTYYKAKSYYPYTPTAGCLATIELWNETDGSLQKSNQYLLTQALQKAGGAIGYLIVVEIDHNSSELDAFEPAIKFKNILTFLH